MLSLTDEAEINPHTSICQKAKNSDLSNIKRPAPGAFLCPNSQDFCSTFKEMDVSLYVLRRLTWPVSHDCVRLLCLGVVTRLNLAYALSNVSNCRQRSNLRLDCLVLYYAELLLV